MAPPPVLLTLLVVAGCCWQAGADIGDWMKKPLVVTTTTRDVKRTQTSVSKSHMTRQVSSGGSRNTTNTTSSVASAKDGELHERETSGPTGAKHLLAFNAAGSKDDNKTGPGGTEWRRTGETAQVLSVGSTGPGGVDPERVTSIKTTHDQNITRTGPEEPGTVATKNTTDVLSVSKTGPEGPEGVTVAKRTHSRSVNSSEPKRSEDVTVKQEKETQPDPGRHATIPESTRPDPGRHATILESTRPDPGRHATIPESTRPDRSDPSPGGGRSSRRTLPPIHTCPPCRVRCDPHRRRHPLNCCWLPIDYCYGDGFDKVRSVVCDRCWEHEEENRRRWQWILGNRAK